MDNKELMHHGILGQKWGVRRYQNPDGTLTELGKRRRGITSKSSNNGSKKTESTRSAEKAMKKDVRNRSSMTNQELREKIEHLRLQRELRTLTDEELRPGRVAFDKIIKEVGTKVATTALTGAALYGLKTIVSGFSGDPNDRKVDWPQLGQAMATGSVGGKKKKDS